MYSQSKLVPNISLITKLTDFAIGFSINKYCNNNNNGWLSIQTIFIRFKQELFNNQKYIK